MAKGKKEYSEKDGKMLLKLARESITEDFDGKKTEVSKEKKFQDKRGVFVTLKEKGNNNLRGCIGFPYPNLPLSEAIYRAAKQAAFNDTRFMPLKKEEIDKIKIEVSILTLPEEIEIKNNKDLKNIKIGKDGLICNYLGYSGLLLPQVATEYNMGKIEFLECLCNKAGLPKDAWKNNNFKLYKFQAQIFSEK